MAGSIQKSTVKDILDNKGHLVHSITSGTTIYDAVVEMTDKGVGCLMVIDDEDIKGIVTERDYLRKVIIRGRSSKESPVSDIMTQDLVVVSEDATVEECLAIMTEKRFRHLPVLNDENKLCGLISVGDLIKQLSRDQKATIHYLNEYIADRYPA